VRTAADVAYGRAEERASIARWLIAEAERLARDGEGRRVEVETIRQILDAVLKGQHLR
jgi:hypothetical protein